MRGKFILEFVEHFPVVQVLRCHFFDPRKKISVAYWGTDISSFLLILFDFTAILYALLIDPERRRKHMRVRAMNFVPFLSLTKNQIICSH